MHLPIGINVLTGAFELTHTSQPTIHAFTDPTARFNLHSLAPCGIEVPLSIFRTK